MSSVCCSSPFTISRTSSSSVLSVIWAELWTVATCIIWNVQYNTKVLRVIFTSNWLPFIWHKQSIVDIGPSFLSEADTTGFFWRGFPSGRVIVGWPSAVANFSLGHQYRDSFAKHGTTRPPEVSVKRILLGCELLDRPQWRHQAGDRPWHQRVRVPFINVQNACVPMNVWWIPLNWHNFTDRPFCYW